MQLRKRPEDVLRPVQIRMRPRRFDDDAAAVVIVGSRYRPVEEIQHARKLGHSCNNASKTNSRGRTREDT